MSGLTSPAASSVALPAKVAPPSAHASGVPSLAAFTDLMIGKIVPPAAKGAPGDGARQDDAATGNSLPDKDKQIDPSLAWLFGAMPIETAEPVTVGLPVDSNTPVIGPVEPDIPSTVGLPLPPALPSGKGAPIVIDEIVAPDVPTPQMVELAPAKSDVSRVLPAPKLVAEPVTPLPVAPLAAVVLPALFALGHTLGRGRRNEELPSAPAVTAATLSQAATLPVAPMGDAQRQTLDLGRQDWPQKMIDHIEALRDNADANDTSIRLKPEALGRVDVSLKTHNDGAISVRFAAEQPATRTLLVDAAPQLAAAAEARGIRLSGTSFDLSGQGHNRPRPEIERPLNISNHLAAPSGDDNPTVDDGRIA